jgi:CMP-N-acetylneuraminic acid synthetase
MEKYKILAIIPARGGSKGLPKKNIKKFAGSPLISWTIKAAQKSKYLDRIIVSTEDSVISKISRTHGSEIIERPRELANDTSSTYDVIAHVISCLRESEKYKPDIIILLQPTSPLRTTEDIDKALDLFIDNPCESVISVYDSGHSVYWSFQIEKKYLKPVFEGKYFKQRRQDLPEAYIPNGAICITTTANLEKYKSFYSRKILPYIMSAEMSVDIDNDTNFKLAELLIKKRDGI